MFKVQDKILYINYSLVMFKLYSNKDNIAEQVSNSVI